MLQLDIGDVAVCQKDTLGLVLEKRVYHEGDGVIRTRYSGVQISDPSKKWETIKPKRYIGSLSWITDFYINS